MLYLGELPSEVLIKILWNVHWTDLDRCCSLSQHFYKVIRESQLLQYSLELGRRGYRLRPFSSAAHPSIPECVAALRRIDALWKEPRFKKLNDKPIPLSYEGWENRWSPYANYIFSAPRQETDDPSLPETYDRVDCVDLEELLDGNATIPKLKSFRFGFAFTNWAHDIHRDLIILVDDTNLALHFMSARDQKPHPVPIQNPIFFDSPENRHLYEDWRIEETKLLTRLDCIMVKVVRTSGGRSVPSYYLMNWVTGKMLKEWVSMKSMRFKSYCTRKDETGRYYLLLIGIQENPFGGSPPFLQVYTFPSFRPEDINLLATFLFPSLVPDASLDHDSLNFPSIAAARGSSPFDSNPSLVVVEFAQQLWFITRLSTILDPEVTQQKSSGVPLVFPWDTWGPLNVRTIYCDTFGFEATGNIVGSRILLEDRILDFDRQRVADALQNSSLDVVDWGTSIETPLFTSTTSMKTSLPYVERHITFPTSSASSKPYTLDIVECMDGPRVTKWHYDQSTLRVQFLDIFALY